EITIRDQCALQLGHVEFTGGWDESHLLTALGERVFFWPGDNDGPIAHGRRLFDAYRSQHQTTLRVGFRDLLAANLKLSPYFSRFNSGGPRTVAGRKSPRGPDTFLAAKNWIDTPSRVVEVSFVGSVSLPQTSEVWEGTGWQQL